MLKSEVGESRRAPAKSFLSAGARFRFRPSLPPVSRKQPTSVLHYKFAPNRGFSALFGALNWAHFGRFLGKNGGFKRFFELDAHFSVSPENRLNFIGYQ